MSYANFSARVWARAIGKDLLTKAVFAEDCNRQYEGEVKGLGDSVRILGVGHVPVKTLVGIKDITLDEADKVSDTSVTMQVDHVSLINFGVGDIDKAQQKGNLMGELKDDATARLINETDKAIASLALDKMAVKSHSTTQSITQANVLDYFDNIMQMLYENDVEAQTPIIGTVPPWLFMMARRALITADTDNTKRLGGIQPIQYGGLKLKMTNNTAVSGDASLPMFRTNRAIAYAAPLFHIEPYRPESKFEDAVKGFVLYGEKIVRPKEMFVMPCKKG